MDLVLRTLIGALLGIVLSVIGIGTAWGLYVFFGAASHSTLLTMFLIGAGLGAGVGGYVSAMRVDRAPPWPYQLLIGLALVLAGIAGAWGGYQFGATREVECCVGPSITPITYTAMGATVGANVFALGLWVVYRIKSNGGWGKFRHAAANSPVAPTGEPRGVSG